MNFLSTGNQFTEMHLNRSKSTLIVGENGAGKSTMLDALYFALFGRPFRNINKPQLLNSITGKNLLVEVEFTIGTKSYLIRRGIKPAIFDIEINGELINQSSSSREYQDILEKNILKMSPKSFGQIVVLGSADFVPFMQLPAQHRRDVIEDLLDIQVFSVMNSLLKDKVAINKTSLYEIDYQIDLREQKIDLHKKHIETLNRSNAAIIKQKEQRILEYEVASDNFISLNNSVGAKVLLLNDSISDSKTLSVKTKKLQDMERQLQDRIKKLAKDVQFFHDHDNCPTCKQGIDHEFKANTIEKRQLKSEEISKALITLEEEYTKANIRIEEIAVTNISITELNSSINDNFRSIQFNNTSVRELQNEIINLKKDNAKDTTTTEELKTLNKDLIENKTNKETLLNNRELHDVASFVLKDTGIKTRIIKQYIPIMNKLINKYLAAMEFFVQFELDESFNETIKSRFRDNFSYNSFSEGEKMRIDLALLFAWRAIAKLRNSACTNLLIMDEVFDGSADQDGIETVINILVNLDVGQNIFIISHSDQLCSRFESTVRFEKHSSFSKIV